MLKSEENAGGEVRWCQLLKAIFSLLRMRGWDQESVRERGKKPNAKVHFSQEKEGQTTIAEENPRIVDGDPAPTDHAGAHQRPPRVEVARPEKVDLVGEDDLHAGGAAAAAASAPSEEKTPRGLPVVCHPPVLVLFLRAAENALHLCPGG